MSTPQGTGRGLRHWAVALIFLAGVVVGLSLDWLHPVAHAQIPDAGLQRNQLQREMEALNGNVSEVLNLLRTQTFKVKIVQDDEKAGAKPGLKSPAKESPRSGSP